MAQPLSAVLNRPRLNQTLAQKNAGAGSTSGLVGCAIANNLGRVTVLVDNRSGLAKLE